MTTEEWASLTEDEVREAVEAAGCRKCRYRGGRANSTMPVHCDYLGITGRSRGYTVDECPYGSAGGGKAEGSIPARPITARRYNRPTSKRRMNDPKIGELLYRGIGESNMDVAELARRVGVSVTSVYSWMNGTSRPSENNQQKISEILGIKFTTEGEKDGVYR